MTKIDNQENKIILKDIEVEKEFEDLFEFTNEEDEDQHEARMIMYRFLSEIERVSGPEKGLKKKLAGLVGRSRSYITQLFNGDKLVNLVMLAKFQKALSIKFKVVAYSEENWESESFTNVIPTSRKHYESTSNNVYNDSYIEQRWSLLDVKGGKLSESLTEIIIK